MLVKTPRPRKPRAAKPAAPASKLETAVGPPMLNLRGNKGCVMSASVDVRFCVLKGYGCSKARGARDLLLGGHRHVQGKLQAEITRKTR